MGVTIYPILSEAVNEMAVLSKEALAHFTQQKHDAEIRMAMHTSYENLTFRQAKLLTVDEIMDMYQLYHTNKPHVITEMI